MMFTKRFLSLLPLLCVAVSAFSQGLSSFKLSEVVVGNENGLVDEYGNHSPWVEITNSSWSSTDLSGCYITSDPSVLDPNLTAPQRIAKMSLIPKGDVRTNIGPKGHIVFFVDGKVNLGTLHTNFTLTPNQENFVALYEGNGVKMIDSVTIPAGLPTDNSYARFFENGGKESKWLCCTPDRVTPNSANDNMAVKENKTAEFKEKDPHGFGMTILGMGIVFSCLVLLWLFFTLFGKIARKFEKKDDEQHSASAITLTSSVSKAAPAPAPQDKDMATIMAVISMALYEDEQDAHDEESGIITIVPTPSPWSSRELEMIKRSK